MDPIAITIQFVKQKLKSAEGGHDWFHIERVWKNALGIAQHEGGNLLIIQLGALLHDIADYKFNNGDETIGPGIAENFLESIFIDRKVIDAVVSIVTHISYKGGTEKTKDQSLEFQIVQDADRLDAIGAIGIGRTFNFGGHKGNKMYDPEISPQPNQSKEEYKKSNGTTINHFHEKLLLLKDLMNTPRGKVLAKDRHEFMLAYLQQFEAEINAFS